MRFRSARLNSSRRRPGCSLPSRRAGATHGTPRTPRAGEPDQLDPAGKADWAAQEFAHLAEHAADPVLRRAEPWRRTAGVHDVRTPRGLAVVRELWLTRDDIAARLDKAPGRVLGDRAISELAIKAEAAASPVLGSEGLRAVSGFSWRVASRFEGGWLAA